MKTLTRITLVQWYRIEAIDIPIVGNTAIVGDNGAGKSALLDAVQAILTGCNKNRMVLNRGSNEQSSRKLWEYVLGVLSDPKNQDMEDDIRPREKAYCYLSLNFYDKETEETTCVGLCLYASLENMDDNLEGLFIGPGLIGSKDLFLDHQEDGRVFVLPWARAKERLEHKCPQMKFYKTSGQYTKELYHYLSEEAAAPIDSETILKALRAAFRLEKIEDPSEFIRQYMLDQDDLQIQELQAELQNYRYLEEKTRTVSQRITQLGHLEDFCSKVEDAHARELQGQWISLSARIDDGEDRANPFRDVLGDLENACEEMDKRKEDLDKNQGLLQTELGEKRAILSGLDINSQRKQITLNIEQEQARKESAIQKINNVLHQAERVLANKDASDIDILSKALNHLEACLPGENLIDRETWPTEPSRLDRCLAELREGMERCLPILDSRYGLLSSKLHDTGERQKEITRQVRDLENKKSPLCVETRGLIRALNEKGISATPLCEIVDVSHSKWRSSVESILGHVREALIVAPEHAEKAVRYYRGEGRREFPRCHIVNTTQTERWLAKQQDNSLAGCLVTENPHARAFLNRRLGNIICVESEKDLLSHSRAATSDGMFNSGGTITELQSVRPLLGQGETAREALLVEYKKEQQILIEKQTTLDGQQKQLGKFNSCLSGFNDWLDSNPISWPEIVAQREGAIQQLQVLGKQLERLAHNDREQQLENEIKKLDEQLTHVRTELGQLSQDRINAEREKAQKHSDLQGLETYLDGLQEDVNILRANPALDTARASDVLERWRDQEDHDCKRIIERADKEVTSARATIQTNEKKIYEGFAEYLRDYASDETGIERPNDFGGYTSLIKTRKKQLEDTALADYRAKAGRALIVAEETFRSKFVSRLIGKLDGVRSTIHQLNKILEKHPFHGEEIYKFRSNANPEYQHIIRFAEAVSKSGAQEAGGLFDPAGDPDSPHRQALDDIAAALQDPAQAKRLQDYRNYLIFQIEMLNKEGKSVGSLDYRIKKGSGGENQTPFYVAIGSSLAAAYRIRQGMDGKAHGGMSLAVFDEAFSKLGFNTCHRCTSFLTSINLQLLVAAPDEKFGTMAEVMDQVVWVTRDGGTVEVDVQYIKPSMRALLWQDNPYRNSVGGVPEVERESA